MRTIKFRAWDKEEQRDCKLMQYTGLKDKNGKEIYEGDIVEVFDENIALENRLIKKYSKTKGNNGIKIVLGGAGDERVRGVVEYKSTGYVCVYQKKTNMKHAYLPVLEEDYRKSEIIGNIYENPELLND